MQWGPWDRMAQGASEPGRKSREGDRTGCESRTRSGPGRQRPGRMGNEGDQSKKEKKGNRGKGKR